MTGLISYYVPCHCYKATFTTVCTDTRLSKSKHPRERFQISVNHTVGCGKRQHVIKKQFLIGHQTSHVCYGGGKRWNGCAAWHVAWLAEWTGGLTKFYLPFISFCRYEELHRLATHACFVFSRHFTGKMWFTSVILSLQFLIITYSYTRRKISRAGVRPKILGRGGRPVSQNPYPIYDQNLRFSLPIYDLTKNLIPYL